MKITGDYQRDGFAFVEHPWEAFACSVVSGAGLGAAGTADRTLVVRLVTPEQREGIFLEFLQWQKQRTGGPR